VPSSNVRPESMSIGKRDQRRLMQYIAAWEAKLSRDAEHLAKVRARLRSCVELPGNGVPATQVTIGSQVCIRDVDTGKSFVWTVVLPRDEEVALTARFPLSWCGATLIGARDGDELLLESPVGRRRIRIDAVLFQPEIAERPPSARRSPQ
jgi:regulator of nucleoside diphosphate kinase